MLFDLASLAKPLVTAPLALDHLDLDLDRRAQLGFTGRPESLTVRQLLSHSAGLPPWLPYTGEPLAAQLARGFPAAADPLLKRPAVGASCYSDLGYRLLAELLELETGVPFPQLGAAATGLEPFPWASPPPFAPQGQDAGLWPLVEPDLPFPPRDPHLPNDANARAGMRGHAGFGATPGQLRARLERWLAADCPRRMAVDTAQGDDGARWGLGLQRSFTGPGRFGDLLAALPADRTGVHVLVHEGSHLSPPAPAEGDRGPASAFWFHLGYTGPALFVRPETGLCIAILAHRLGPSGQLLTREQLQDRRWEALAGFR